MIHVRVLSFAHTHTHPEESNIASTSYVGIVADKIHIHEPNMNCHEFIFLSFLISFFRLVTVIENPFGSKYPPRYTNASQLVYGVEKLTSS